MSPKPLEDIFGDIQNSTEVSFIHSTIRDSQADILSYPCEKVVLTLKEFVNQEHVYKLREQLFMDFCDQFRFETLLENQINIDPEKPLKSLRKRYKPIKCYDDIYVLLISLYENQIDSKIEEVIIFDKNLAVKKTVMSSFEAAIIDHMTEVLSINKEILNENKILKIKLSSLEAKFDSQQNILNELYSDHINAQKANAQNVKDNIAMLSSEQNTQIKNTLPKQIERTEHSNVDQTLKSNEVSTKTLSETYASKLIRSENKQRQELPTNMPHSDDEFSEIGRNNRIIRNKNTGIETGENHQKKTTRRKERQSMAQK